VEWHHNAYFVFGHPNQGEEKYDERLARHLKYKQRYESLQWMIEGIDPGSGFELFEWGR
jgi:hypothetical protein